MRRLAPAVLVASLLAGGLTVAPPAAVPVRAAEYELETAATYAVDPDERRIGVTVELDFTNTTPDPEGQFSVFEEIRLAVHDQARDVAATDDEGELEVAIGDEDDVTVATIELREPLRYEESVSVELTYELPDTDDPHMRVRPSAVVFPAWGFGTRSQVRVTLPDDYEVRVDGDPLEADGSAYVSGVIDDPSRWLALVTALRPVELASIEQTVPLAGGTADLVVRSFADDEAWGQRIRDLMVEALPLVEEELGLPYPLLGRLVVTQTVPLDASGLGESDGATSGTELLIAYDQPDFTAIHQLVHVWVPPAFAEARWVREGLASAVAARVAERMDVEPPFDRAAVLEERAESAFPLDAWSSDAGPDGEAFGYAAAWDVVAAIEAEVGPEALSTVLRRVAAGIGPYQPSALEPEPTVEGVRAPRAPLTSLSFLDQLETVTGADLAPLFAERVLTAEHAGLLDARRAARAAFDALVAAAGSWGAPDPVRGAMTSWSFEAAESQIDEALAWLNARDALMARMAEVGLSPSERLKQAYRAYGGGADADQELEAHAAVVELYAEAAEAMNAPRGLIERIGLIGGPQPEREVAAANGLFASGELRDAASAIAEAQRILDAAMTSGIVRLVSAALVVVLLLGLAVAMVRRRAAYTQRR